MKKKKNIFSVLILCFSVVEASLIVLVSVGVLKLWLFFVLLGVCALPIVVFAVLVAKLKKKIELAKLKAQNDVKSSGNYMLDIYAILGVAPQYDKDGKLIDIYEILKIKPVFDEQGNRVLTVYELLGVAPLLDENGNEIPVVFALKNRVGKIAKVRLSTEFLTRKLTPEEEEERLIQEMLRKKLEEAEKAGDTQKAKAIKEAIKNNKKAEKPKKKAGPIVSYKPANGQAPKVGGLPKSTFKPTGFPSFKKPEAGNQEQKDDPGNGAGQKGGDNSGASKKPSSSLLDGECSFGRNGVMPELGGE